MPRRFLAPTLLALLTLAATPTAASAGDLYAAPGGAGAAPCAAAAPCTVADAVLAARAAPGADVIHLAAGTYADAVRAAGAADTDLTFAGAGIGATTIAAAPAGDAPVMELGAGSGDMTVRDLTVDATGAGTFAAALRSRLTALALLRVRLVQTGAAPKQAPALDADVSTQTTTLDGVEVTADTQTGDAAIGAVNVGGPATVRDSRITHTAAGAASALYARGPLTVLRSRITHGDADAGYALRVVNTTDALPIIVDSTALAGGHGAARFELGTAASTVALRGDTFAPAATATNPAVDVQSNVQGSQVTATISSSLIVSRTVRSLNGPVVTCSFSNVPGVSGPVACPTTAGATNTKLTPAELQLGGDLAPLPGSPAIDTGDPAGVAGGESATDVLGHPRAGSSADVCDAGPGRRDKGAFERYRPSPQVTIDGPASAARGAAVTFSAVTAVPGLELAWSFGDGTGAATGPQVTHAFTVLPGSASLTARDPLANCATTVTRSIAQAPIPAPPAGPATGALDRTAPALRAARLMTRRVRPGGALRLRFRLGEAATVTVTVARRSGVRLVAPRRTRVRAAAGTTTLTIPGRRLRLARGRYAVQLRARDAAGNAGRTATLRFSVR